jgi:hypothetical protein
MNITHWANDDISYMTISTHFLGWRCSKANYHYEKLHPLKLHYLATKIQKTTHIQLLCNYPPYKYGLLINKLSCQKIS